MFRFQRLTHQGSVQLALVAIAVGTWLSGCGDDEEGGGGKGKGGSSGTAGNAGAVTGGSAGSPTGGASGSPTGGAAGSTTAGSGGMTTAGTGGVAGSAGNAGSAGTGAEGGAGMGGEGGIGDGGMAGTGMAGAGMGGEGGTPDMTCATGDLSFTLVSSEPMQQHDHLPVQGMNRTTLLGMINTGMPLVFTMPSDGTNAHTHTLTFTAGQLTTLRNGGTIAMITSSMGGPAMNMHTHTYSIECAP